MKEPLFRTHAEMDQRHWWFRGRQRIAQELIHQLSPPGRGGRVVDLGCGTGVNLAPLAKEYETIGLDPSPEAIRLAQQRFPKVRFICAPLPEGMEKIPKGKGVFLLMDVLEHVPDDRLFLSGIVAGLEPGSHLLITVPADMRLWSPHDVAFSHFRRYDALTLRRVWEGLPVTLSLLSYYNSRLYPVVRAARTLSRLRGAAGGREGTDFTVPAAPVNALLERLFAGEAAALRRTLAENGGRMPYRLGVSLIAILRRNPSHAG